MEDQVIKYLENLIEIRKARRASYGDAVGKKGALITALFKDSEKPVLESEIDYSRFGALNFMLSKLIRYAENFNKNGHDDSLDDLAVYTLILKDLDRKKNNAGN